MTCFVSMEKSEINTDRLLRYCFEDEKKVYLPRIIGDNLDQMIMLQTFNFNEIYDETTFTKSKWGIWEPKLTYVHHQNENENESEKKENVIVKNRENAMDTLDLDLMIIPGVAFNENNYRLGHGKGHYDRYFTKYKAACLAQNTMNKINAKFPYLIGIGLAVNYTENIPIEDHDWTLDKIVTFNSSHHVYQDNV